MNYYARLYNVLNDDYTPDYTKRHVFIVEGMYEVNLRQKARVIGDINITDNSFFKRVKQPYDVISIGEYTITLKKSGEYTLLSHVLTSEGCTSERIAQITTAIHAISNNTSIKTNQNCYGDWISLD